MVNYHFQISKLTNFQILLLPFLSLIFFPSFHFNIFTFAASFIFLGYFWQVTTLKTFVFNEIYLLNEP